MNMLKELRTAKGVSQQTVADYLGITRQAYSNYETGKRTIDNENLLKVAEYFETSTDYVLRGQSGTKKSAAQGGGGVSDEALKYALFGGAASDAQFAEVKRFAQFVWERDKERDDDDRRAGG